MLKKVRLYNAFILMCVFLGMVIPLVLKYTCKWIPLFSISLFVLAIVYFLERQITFEIIKSLDHLKWINDTGVGPIFILVKILAILVGIVSMFAFLENPEAGTYLIAVNIILVLHVLESTRVYMGDRFIYVQESYIDMKDITQCEYMQYRKGKHMHYTQFKLDIGKKSYTFRMQETPREESLILVEKLSKYPIQMIQLPPAS